MEHLLFIDDCQNHFIMVNDYIQENYGITNFYTAEVFLEADDSWFSKFIEGVKNFFINLGKKIWHFISHFPDYVDKFYNWLVNLTKSEEELNEKLKYDVIVQSQPIRKLSEMFGSVEKMSAEALRLANMFNSAKEIEVDKESISKLGNAISAFLKNINYDENKELIHKLLNNSDTAAILGEMVFDERPQEQFGLYVLDSSKIDITKSMDSSNLPEAKNKDSIYFPIIHDGAIRSTFKNGRSVFQFFTSDNNKSIEIQTHNFDIPINGSNTPKSIYAIRGDVDNVQWTIYYCFYDPTTQTILWAVKDGNKIEWKSNSDLRKESWFDGTKLLFNAGKGIAQAIFKSDGIHKKVQAICEKALGGNKTLIVDRERNEKLNSVMKDAFRCFNMIKDRMIVLSTHTFGGSSLNLQKNNVEKLNNSINAFSSKSAFLISRNYDPSKIVNKISVVEGLWMLTPFTSAESVAKKVNLPVVSMDSIRNANAVENMFQQIIRNEIEGNYNPAVKSILPSKFTDREKFYITLEQLKNNNTFEQSIEEYKTQIDNSQPKANNNAKKSILTNLANSYQAFAKSISYIRQYVQVMLFISKLIELTNKFITPIYTGKK